MQYGQYQPSFVLGDMCSVVVRNNSSRIFGCRDRISSRQYITVSRDHGVKILMDSFISAGKVMSRICRRCNTHDSLYTAGRGLQSYWNIIIWKVIWMTHNQSWTWHTRVSRRLSQCNTMISRQGATIFLQSYTLELEAKVAKFREMNPELQKNQTGVGSLFVYPEELHKLLVYFKDTYNEPKINITEKGYLRLIQAVVPLMESRKKGK
ncbi:uncharacterized protein [Henckelia pumila]|uniref:uncharacterized protein isoform X2 n=1 Tax=Henckelia pumila TaxID=405737 RepID=UPI003C6DC79D